MSHPLLVECIESQFVPGLIYNNKKIDAQKLARFQEPAWNNPVIRFLSPDLTDLLPRKDRVWSTAEVTARLIEALKAAKRKVPNYLNLVRLESSNQTAVATFAMHCYWEGEVQFGKLAGVKETSSAWYDGKEIVNVTFDPTITSYKQLVQTAIKVRCASTIYVRDPKQEWTARSLAKDQVQSIDAKEFGKPAKPSDQKYYLRLSPLSLLPLTQVQRVRINSALGTRADPAKFLSPQQVKADQWLKKNSEDTKLVSELRLARSRLDFNSYYDFVARRQKSEPKVK